MSLTAAATLSGLARSGPTPLTALAQRQGVTQPAMTQLVSRLERDGLATRVPDHDDGRVVLVAITSAGLAAVDERRAERARLLSSLMQDLRGEEIDALTAALPALRR